MKVIAIQRGYDGVSVRDPDDIDQDTGRPAVFDMPDGSKGSWFVEVDEDGRPLEDLPKKKKDKTIPGAGPAKGSQLDRNYPKGQAEA